MERVSKDAVEALNSKDIIDEDWRKNAEMMENAFYNKENLNPQMKEDKEESKKIEISEGVDAELLMKVLANYLYSIAVFMLIYREEKDILECF